MRGGVYGEVVNACRVKRAPGTNRIKGTSRTKGTNRIKGTKSTKGFARSRAGHGDSAGCKNM